MAKRILLADYSELLEERGTEEIDDLPCEACDFAGICLLQRELHDKEVGSLVLVIAGCPYQK